jgi:hypothetical protein
MKPMESDQAIANLIASTRTKKRSVSLLDFHNWLEKAINALGSLQLVADSIGLSTRMLKQFLVIEKLDKSVLPHVKARTLDSIDTLNYLARFTHRDQRNLLPILLKKQLSSKDLRSVYQQRSVLPDTSIAQLIKRVASGKNRRVYELQFVLRGDLTKEQIAHRVRAITKPEGLEAVALDGPVGKVLLSRDGLQRFRTYARDKRIAFKSVLSHLLNLR